MKMWRVAPLIIQAILLSNVGLSTIPMTTNIRACHDLNRHCSIFTILSKEQMIDL